ncbi:MAG: hypothetical protein JEZ12_02340 [Desulfobacterium sp.]|nr:hypothetical protein [Desulfobacterium sp.]
MIETQLNLWQILAANGAIGLSAFLQSGAGFGMALVSVPLLALIDPGFVPGPFILVSLLQGQPMGIVFGITILIAPPFRRYLDRTNIRCRISNRD